MSRVTVAAVEEHLSGDVAGSTPVVRADAAGVAGQACDGVTAGAFEVLADAYAETTWARFSSA